MKCDKQNFLSLWTIFCPFTPPSPPTNLKKGLEISFYTWVPCTKNDNHRMYGSWDMKHDRHNFLSFWTIFCPFTPLKAQKIKILKKWKKYLQILSFYTSVPKIIIIWYIPPQIWCMTDVIVIFQFGLLFAQKTKISKKWKKNNSRYHHFTHVYQKLWLYDLQFVRYGVRQMNGQMKNTVFEEISHQ